MLARWPGGFILGMILLWGQVWAQSELITNLQSRLNVSINGNFLIKSFTNHSQSYIYDQALAIIAFTKHGEQKTARKLLRALATLQKQDGSLYFSYYIDGKSPYPEEGDKRFAGAIAWVALAAVTYQNEFKSDEFVNFNYQILDYLISQLKTFKGKDKKLRAISFGPSDIAGTPWNENDIGALEHNLDAYAAFLHFSKLNNDEKTKGIAEELKEFILGLWDESKLHFWSGVNLKTGNINKEEFYLDNQTWSLLALDEKILKKLKPKEALTMNCDSLMVEHDGIKGFMDMKPANRPSKLKFVWSEGSAGQFLAMKKVSNIYAEKITCNDLDAEVLLENIGKMKKKDGGIAYATSSENPDFTTDSSVAGTAWYYFALMGINPFKLE